MSTLFGAAVCVLFEARRGCRGWWYRHAAAIVRLLQGGGGVPPACH
eukprot:gene35277-30068_t